VAGLTPQPSQRSSQTQKHTRANQRRFTIVMQRRNTEKQLANLKPFKPGQSGNPAGRPKKALLSDALRRQLAITAPGMPERTQAEAIASALISEAIAGNIAAAREICDRTEGRPMQSIGVDLDVRDWRQMAQSNGLEIDDVLTEAKLLLAESLADSSGE
jgi:hypothetical protein